MTKNVLLIGLGRFGKHMAMDLNRLGHEVMAVDLNEDRVNEILPYVTNAQIGDSTNEEFLESLGIGNYDLCVVAIGNNFQNSLETTSLLKDMGARLVVSRAERDVQAKFLLRNGADKVVYPERQMAKWAAIRFTADHILDFIEVDDTHAIFEVEMPRQWIGKTVGQLNIRQKYNINIVAIKRGENINMSISSETTLKEGETLLVIGEYKTLQRCFQM
ncbi:MAG: TrkA family potassium uptake protein [Clostridiaceae bacterium]|nr:TrkA family potassium uptake protein [Clostridiaceae bacterium]